MSYNIFVRVLENRQVALRKLTDGLVCPELGILLISFMNPVLNPQPMGPRPTLEQLSECYQQLLKCYAKLAEEDKMDPRVIAGFSNVFDNPSFSFNSLVNLLQSPQCKDSFESLMGSIESDKASNIRKEILLCKLNEAQPNLEQLLECYGKLAEQDKNDLKVKRGFYNIFHKLDQTCSIEHLVKLLEDKSLNVFFMRTNSCSSLLKEIFIHKLCNPHPDFMDIGDCYSKLPEKDKMEPRVIDGFREVFRKLDYEKMSFKQGACLCRLLGMSSLLKLFDNIIGDEGFGKEKFTQVRDLLKSHGSFHRLVCRKSDINQKPELAHILKIFQSRYDFNCNYCVENSIEIGQSRTVEGKAIQERHRLGNVVVSKLTTTWLDELGHVLYDTPLSERSKQVQGKHGCYAGFPFNQGRVSATLLKNSENELGINLYPVGIVGVIFDIIHNVKFDCFKKEIQALPMVYTDQGTRDTQTDAIVRNIKEISDTGVCSEGQYISLGELKTKMQDDEHITATKFNEIIILDAMKKDICGLFICKHAWDKATAPKKEEEIEKLREFNATYYQGQLPLFFYDALSNSLSEVELKMN